MFAFPVSNMSLKKKTYLDVLALQIYYTAHFDPVVLFAPRLRTEDIITQGIRMNRSDVVYVALMNIPTHFSQAL